MMGGVDFIPELNLWGKCWYLRKITVRFKIISSINRQRFKRMARACQIMQPLTCTLPEAWHKLLVARERYLDLNSDSMEMHQAFLSEIFFISVDSHNK